MSLLQRRARSLLWLAAGLLAATAAWADDAATEPVRLRIVLLRHSVRSPTKAPQELGVYAAQAWPEWPVEPGQLTPHGVDVMRALGGWHRRQLDADGLVGAGCDAVPAIRIVSDSTPRNHASAAALAAGLMPGCAGAGYHAFPAGQADPLFRGLRKAESREGGAPPVDATGFLPALTALQQVLLGCADGRCLAQAREAGKTPLLDACLLQEPAERLSTACATKTAQAIKTAGSLAENLMLEQAQGMPAEQVGWGRLDAAGIGRLITLHNLSFQRTQKDDLAEARRHASHLLAHLAATLDAAAGATPAVAPLAPSGTRVLFLVAHDTNLASIAGLLGLDWHDARQPDDYPPGAALVFDLLGAPEHARVRVTSALPTLAALRAARFDDASALVTRTLTPPGCEDACTPAQFQALVDRRIDAKEVAAAVAPAPFIAVAAH
jgi:4-phytase/acid phosphatase